MEEKLEDLNKTVNKKWQHWHFKNTAFLILSLVVFFYLADTPQIKSMLSYIGELGYIGAFIAGILFVSIFTIGPASVILFFLAQTLNPLGIAIAAGLGSALGDYLLLRYLKDRVFDELKPVFLKHGGRPLQHLFKTPYFIWLVPIVGAIIIISPIPDEVGLGLMGISKIKIWQLIALLYLLNALGIFFIVTAAKSF